MGIGEKLLMCIKEFVAKEGTQTVDWYVNNRNVGAIGFYEKVGASKLIYYMEI